MQPYWYVARAIGPAVRLSALADPGEAPASPSATTATPGF